LVSGLKPNRRTNARIARGTGRSTPLLRLALATVAAVLDSATAGAAMVLSAAIRAWRAEADLSTRVVA
jgi:hypothetical protein